MAEGKRIKKVLRVGRATDSSLSSFVERPIPTDKEVAMFERVVGREVHEQEIDSNLSEIYSDQDGKKVDVRKMDVKKRLPFLIRLFRRFLIVAVLGLAAYFAYSYWFAPISDVSGLELVITSPERIAAGEEFSYHISYSNPTKYPLSRLRLELQYPIGFVFHSSSIEAGSGDYGWDLPDLGPGEKGSLIVTGQLISPPDSVQVVFGNLSYLPGTFSSQFKKEASASSLVSGPGFRVDLNYSGTAFLDQDNEMTLIISEITDNYLGDFNITFTVPAEASASVIETATTTSTSTTATGTVQIIKSGGTTWQLSGLGRNSGRQEIPLTYRIKQRSDKPEIKVRLEKRLEDGQSYVFWEKTIQPELVDSDLNLTLLLNGSKNDGSLNFSQPLDYSLTYDNRGANTFQDVVIMAALSGDFIDWDSLSDSNKGQVKNGTIIWTKNEIPALSEIKPGASGAIDFRLNLRSGRDTDIGGDLLIVSYGQYGMNNTPTRGDANKSNTITSRLNSDLNLEEQIRYFNEDNLPVGSGPLPPRVGEKTGLKVYWTITNNLHELSETRAVFTLPSYASWEGGQTTNVGSLYYDEVSRQIVWEIGRLPVSVYRVDAEFLIGLTPGEPDRNKILIISPGSTVIAMDTETKDTITRKTGPKTTKLEDDDIAGLSNSGIVQ